MFSLTDRLESIHPRVYVALLCHAQPAPEWRAGSERIVEALIRDKFRRNAKAREVLLGTGRVKLVYTNSHDDRVWGVCGGESNRFLRHGALHVALGVYSSAMLCFLSREYQHCLLPAGTLTWRRRRFFRRRRYFAPPAPFYGQVHDVGKTGRR